LKGIGFTEEMLDQPVYTLSGGWYTRCMLAVTLVQTVDVMILDEPTNFLDMLGIVWLQQHIIDLSETSTKTVVVVSHDRDFIDNISEETIILRDKTLSYFRGNLSAYEDDFKNKVGYLTRMQELQEAKADKVKETINTNIRVGKKTGDDNKLKLAKSRQKKMENQTGMQVGQNGGRFKLSRDRLGLSMDSCFFVSTIRRETDGRNDENLIIQQQN